MPDAACQMQLSASKENLLNSLDNAFIVEEKESGILGQKEGDILGQKEGDKQKEAASTSILTL